MTLIVILQYKNQQNEKIRVHIIICNQPSLDMPKMHGQSMNACSMLSCITMRCDCKA